MSAFEIALTPDRVKPKKRIESREPTDVVMAPFSAKAIVQFEDVPVSKTARRILRIINPSSDDIEVKVTRNISEEHNITINWTEKVVRGQDEIEMEMVWSPLNAVACKETIQLTDSRNFRKEIMIILKAKSNKPQKTVKKFPTVSSGASGVHAKTLRLKSPKNSRHANTLAVQIQQKKRMQKFVAENANTIRPHWNSSISNSRKPKMNVTPIKPYSSNVSMLSSNQVYTLSERNNRNPNKQPSDDANTILSPNFDDRPNNNKENISPQTPITVMNYIDKLNFTPAEMTNISLNVSNLAMLPTPVSREYSQISHDLQLIRPRCLTTDDLCQIDNIPTIKIDNISDSPIVHRDDGDMSSQSLTPVNTALLRNKTFEVKGDNLDITRDAIDDSSCSLEGRLSSEIISMVNKPTAEITPLSRHLDIIHEEDSLFDADRHSYVMESDGKLQKTFTKPSADSPYTKSPSSQKDLKRDIKLIGTPLKKYSESMKNLSAQSPQTKFGIQGSMPNLNEMETIRPIESNRYFNQSCNLGDSTISVICKKNAQLNINDSGTSENLNSSQISVVSHAELNFDQYEILAQSSRFNLHEAALKSRKNSPIKNLKIRDVKYCIRTSTKTGLKIEDKSVAQKRSILESSFSDTVSNHSVISSYTTVSTISTKTNNSTNGFTVSPPKRIRTELDESLTFTHPKPIIRTKNWSQTQPKKYKLAQTLSLVKKPITQKKCKDAPRIKLYDSNLYMQSYINPDPFAASTTCDPFLASTMYLDERAVDKHLVDFRKWLNALVAMPAEFNTDCNNKIDVGKLFNEVRLKELMLAPTKEEQSMNYLTKFRLESLRRAAVELFLSEDMRIPCSKVAVYVNKNSLRIRSDRNLHLDVVMQRTILELLLCFNPLWLRLGLEVVYGEKIHLHSNSDVIGLSTFILNRLFRDKFLEQKYSKAYTLSEEYADHIKKFTLQKFLFLLLFLDKAKHQRIIKHNPCLFVKQSTHKETKDILLKFSSELLANVGDISRELKRLGYVLHHKQIYLDEFDYAFNNLAVDLRDGIRLTRVMEIILLREGLSKQLRVPAISRLQRIHNVNLGLKALSEADFQLKGDITAADIVDGHREKTLSLLWQIIYKFRSPKFHVAARVLQKWWRKSYLRVLIGRRITHKKEMRRITAATKIQAVYRGHITRRYAIEYHEKRTQVSIIIQKWIRRWLAQKHYKEIILGVIRIQRWYRARHLGDNDRKKYLELRVVTIKIQQWFHRLTLSKRILLYAKEVKYQRDQRRHLAAKCIQNIWLCYSKMKVDHANYLYLKNSAIICQQRYRANCKMRNQQKIYQQLRSSVIVVQQRYRALKLMKSIRGQYLRLHANVIRMQQRRRTLVQMRTEHKEYSRLLAATVNAQQRFRAKLAMRKDRQSYMEIRKGICLIQLHYRARLAMKQQLAAYQRIRAAVTLIQCKWRATKLARLTKSEFVLMRIAAIRIQQKFHAKRQMRFEHNIFLKLKSAAIVIQQWRRQILDMRFQQEEFQRKRRAVLCIQQRYRAYKQMCWYRAKYEDTQKAVLCLQTHLRGYLKMKRQRAEFKRQQQAAIILQKYYRARLAMKKQQMCYEQLKKAVINIQRRYRALKRMQTERQGYQKQIELIRCIQLRYRAKLYACAVRKQYSETIMKIIKLQRRIRATLLMRSIRTQYLNTIGQIVKIQHYYRSYQLTKQLEAVYQQKRNAAIYIQKWYRSLLQMRIDKVTYQHIRNCILIIQRKYRATLVARKQREHYLATIQKINLIQNIFRATLNMRIERNNYGEVRQATIVIQRRYRAHSEMLKIRSQYLLIHSLIVCIQRKFRAQKTMVQARNNYLQLKRTTIHLQQKFRGRKLVQEQRNHFLLLTSSTIKFQAQIRGYLARKRFQAMMTPQMVEFLKQKKAAKIIQRIWRGYRIRKQLNNVRICTIRKNIKLLKESTTAVNTIRYKMLHAVRVLKGHYGASETLQVLICLDRISRTVPHLLKVNSDFISTFCYDIMAQTIRSEVDKHLLRYCSRIILNLARFVSTSNSSFHEGGLVTIAQILLRWCDKDCEIFNTLCTLIWVFSHCSHRKQIIRKFMTTPEAIYVVRETKKLVARKEKMKQNVRKPIVVNMSSQNPFASRVLPSLEPDYGVINNKPYTFLSSVYAFDTILCKLVKIKNSCTCGMCNPMLNPFIPE